MVAQSQHERKMMHGVCDNEEADIRVASKIDFQKASYDSGQMSRVLEWIGGLLDQHLP